MKKYFLTMAVMALFAIGFTASDEEESSNSESSAPKTEQKQESEADRKAREQKEEAERKAKEQKEKENKKKEIAEKGYKDGYEVGFGLDWHQYETFDFSRMARRDYTAWYGAPSSSEEKELYDIFEQNYKRGIEEGYKAQ